ncbi:MAG TPA: DUF177 domain-containing protein [Acidisarcina sp.]
MLITVADLEREPLKFDLALAPGTIDYGLDVQQLDPLVVAGVADLIVEHRGPGNLVPDIRVRADYRARFQVECARCVEPVEQALGGNFDLLYRPVRADGDASENSITTSETEIGYYQEGGLVLEDVLREQVLLTLPPRTLCREDCKGLCPQCGQDLNMKACNCDGTTSDPRWTALADLRSRIKP